MVNGRRLQQAQSEASMEATRLHRRLGTTFDGPVDVLSIASDLGLVLMVQPLDSLLGFYVRGDDRSGIVINNQIPESLQRFTLAHEIGHHVLGHEGTADDEHALGRFDSSSEVELAAQAFAGSLLMPLPLINRALNDLPATRHSRRLAPSDAYLFSRQLGVSYSAGVWALYRRQLLSLESARTFVKQGSLFAKDTLRGRDRVSDARADVWMLTAENNDLSVMCRVGDEIHVQLPEDTGAGLAWLVRAPGAGGLFDRVPTGPLSWSGGDDLQVDRTAGESQGRETWGAAADEPIEIVQDEHLGEEDLAYAAIDAQLDLFIDREDDPTTRTFPDVGGVRSLTFVPRTEGESRVVMELARPWDAEGQVMERYELDLRVRAKRLAGHGLFAPTSDAWVAERAVGA